MGKRTNTFLELVILNGSLRTLKIHFFLIFTITLGNSHYYPLTTNYGTETKHLYNKCKHAFPLVILKKCFLGPTRFRIGSENSTED